MHRTRTTVGLLLTALVVVSAVSFVGAGVQSPLAAADDGDDWSSDRADAGRTGATNDSGPAPHATEAWNTGFDARAEGGPAVANGTAYTVVTTDADLPATGQVLAYDTATGEKRWTSADVGAATGSPAVANGTVYVATRGTDTDAYEDNGGLYALDAATGEVQWRTENAHRGDPFVADGVVYVANAAYDAATGERLWYGTGTLAGVSDGTAYLHNGSTVWAHDAATGEVQWRARLPTSADTVDAEGAVTSDRVYLTVETANASHPVYALSTDDGSVAWTHAVEASSDDVRANLVSAPAVHDGSVYVSARGDTATVHALDATTGDERWSYDTPADHLSAPTVGNDTVYLGGRYFSKLAEVGDTVAPATVAVYALDATDGTERWNYSTGETSGLVAYAPVVDDGRAYVTVREWNGIYSDESRLYALGSSDAPPKRTRQVAPDKPEIPDVTIETEPADAGERTFRENRTVTLRANASTAPDDEIRRYEWDVDGDGTYERTGQEITVSTEVCGDRKVTVRVVDDDLLTATDSVTLTRT